MKIRVVQIWGFLMTVLGWIFVAVTMAMEGWKISGIGGMGGSAIIKVAWYWSSLWRACYTDSTSVSNCYDFPVLWSVEGYVQAVRGLLMGSLCLGMLGFVLSLMGMECTYIGGKGRSKNRKVFCGGCCHALSGILSTSAYIIYSHYVSVEYLSPMFDGLSYDLGTPIFLGLVGSAFHSTGGFFYLVSVRKEICGNDETVLQSVATPPATRKGSGLTKYTTAVRSQITKTERSSASDLSSEVSEITPRTAESPDTRGYSRPRGRSKSERSERSERFGRSKRTDRSRQSSGTLGTLTSDGGSSRSRSRSSGRSSQTSSSYSGRSRSRVIKNSYI